PEGDQQGGRHDQGAERFQERGDPATAAGAVPERRHGEHVGAGERVHDAGRQQGDAGQYPQRGTADGAGVSGSGGEGRVTRVCAAVAGGGSGLRKSERSGMDAPTPDKVVRINRWLPYWAVLQVDLRQTLRSWVYRGWVLVSLLAAIGYLLYRVGVYRE